MRRYILLVVLVTIAALATHAGAPPNVAQAIAAQQQLVTENPGDAAAYNDLGNLLLIASRDDEAQAAYEKALELAPELVSARFNLALLFDRHGKDSAAARELHKVVKAEPGYSWAWFQLGRIEERRGHRSAAIESYARAYSLNPDLAFAEVNPQVIDSALLTESLLAAYHGWPEQPQAPRDYEDPARVAGLLHPTGQPVPPTGDAPETATEAAAALKEAAASPKPPPASAGAPAAGTTGGGTSLVLDSGNVESGGTRSGGSHGIEGTPVRSWTTPEELQPDEQVDEYVEPQYDEPEAPAAVMIGQPGSPDEGQVEPPPPPPAYPGGFGQPMAPPPGEGFVPGGASSGRLELELGTTPESRTRLARAHGSRLQRS